MENQIDRDAWIRRAPQGVTTVFAVLLGFSVGASPDGNFFIATLLPAIFAITVYIERTYAGPRTTGQIVLRFVTMVAVLVFLTRSYLALTPHP